MGGTVGVSVQVLFEGLFSHLDVVAQLDARYLPAADALVDPALTHPKLLADLRDREQSQPTLLVGAHRRLAYQILFELDQRGFDLFEGSVEVLEGSQEITSG